MKYIYLFFFAVVLSCNTADQPSESSTDTLRHSTAIVKDTSLNAVADNTFETPVLSEIKQHWMAKYNDTITIDTSFALKRGEVHIVFSNYCLFDSSLAVPKRYVKMYGMDKFVSHNFASSLLVQVNGNIVVDTTIDKSFFEQILIKNDFYNLYDYGALIFSNMDIGEDFFDIGYSIAVPLSDVGNAFTARVHYDGRIKVIY